MEKFTGIGGFFFRSKEPEKLAAWYNTHLGINLAPKDMQMPPWVSEEGITVFTPFSENTDYFADDKGFMLNFRVRDLDAMRLQLRDAAIEVSHEMTMDGTGRFARIHDPEGNPLELWELEA